MMTQPTPGPWHLNGRAVEHDEPAQYTERRLTVVVAYLEDDHNDNWKANARLIAAAPRMLEALKEAHQELRLLNVKEDGQQKYNTPTSLVIESLGALLRDLHGGQ